MSLLSYKMRVDMQILASPNFALIIQMHVFCENGNRHNYWKYD